MENETWVTADGRGFHSTKWATSLAAAAAATHDAAEKYRAECAAARAVHAAHNARCGLTLAQVREHNAATLALWAS